MKNIVLLSALVLVAASSFGQSLKEGFEAGPPTFVDGSNQTFGNVPGGATVLMSGLPWHALNAGTPIGAMGWFNLLTNFSPRTGNGQLAANFQNVTNTNDINSFFMSPRRTFSNGDTISFWTRTLANPAFFPDRLELRLSDAGSSTALADFDVVLQQVNPALTNVGYPNVYTQYTATLSLSEPISGRFAFNYNVPSGGPSGTNSDLIAIDDVQYTRAPLTEGFENSPTPGFADGSNVTFGNNAGGDDIVFSSGTWRAINSSVPVGLTSWFLPTAFPARTGTGHIGANFNNTTGNNTISNFLMSPVRSFVNGDKIRFWTRSIVSNFPDRLRLRLSTDGSSTNLGAFNRTLLIVNPLLEVGEYPTDWTLFVATVEGLPGPSVGRFAFQYDVTSAGPLGANSDLISIDDVEHIPAPATQVISGQLGLSDTGNFAPGLSRNIRVEVRQGGVLIGTSTVVATTPEPTYSVEVPFELTGACTVSFDGSSFLRRAVNLTLTGNDWGLNRVLFNGDVDSSGEVDAADIDAVISNFGASFPGGNDPDTDVDVSGEVDAADIDIVIANFGRTDD